MVSINLEATFRLLYKKEYYQSKENFKKPDHFRKAIDSYSISCDVLDGKDFVE